MSEVTQPILLNYKYSIFGNFLNATSNITELAKRFKEYSKQIVSNSVQTIGAPFQNISYLFSSQNISFVISSNRIDFLIPIPSDKDIDFIKNIIEIIIDNNDVITRVAFNYSKALFDDNSKLLNIVSKKFFFLDNEKKTISIGMRHNATFKFQQKDFNDVTKINYSSIQDTKTFVNKNGLVISLDINSSIQKLVKFEKNEVCKYFAELKKVGTSQMTKIIKQLTEAEVSK